jgi:hypothetical protein
VESKQVQNEEIRTFYLSPDSMEVSHFLRPLFAQIGKDLPAFYEA